MSDKEHYVIIRTVRRPLGRTPRGPAPSPPVQPRHPIFRAVPIGIGVAAFTEEQIPELLAQLTLEEKCSLLSGSDFWRTQPVERLGIPALMVSDSPHGLRKQAEGADQGMVSGREDFRAV